MNKKMKVVQCWDDGVSTDIPLIEVLRRYESKATFNLNAGLISKERSNGWKYQNIEVARLGWNEMLDIYDGFVIANHSLMHPRLEQISVDDARKDIVDGRKQLQDFFGASILGFAYPYGSYSDAVMDIIQDAGHTYARTTKNVPLVFPPENAMEFHPTCKFNTEDFYERYEKAKECGVFYFWGHSYEITTDEILRDFEAKIKYISDDAESQWSDVVDLF